MNLDFSKFELEVATLEDAQALSEIMTLSDKHFQPDSKPVGVIEAEEILSGYAGEIMARKLINPDNRNIQAFITLHADSSRNRIYSDTWLRPGANLEAESISLVLQLAKEISSKFELWIGANAKDQNYIEHLDNFRFSLLRTYWGLSSEINQHPYPILPEGVEMNLISDENKSIWWSVHQDSFSKHFGFAPRPFDQWRAMVDKAVGIDLNARWLLYHFGQPVGFLECSDLKKDLNIGFIDGIGVIQKAQGKGFGQLMLSWAFAYYASIGRDSVELNVDTGNESGALRLYEKAGFKVKSSWKQFENKSWASQQQPGVNSN